MTICFIYHILVLYWIFRITWEFKIPTVCFILKKFKYKSKWMWNWTYFIHRNIVNRSLMLITTKYVLFKIKVIAHMLMMHKITINVSQTVICTCPQEKSLKQNEARSNQCVVRCSMMPQGNWLATRKWRGLITQLFKGGMQKKENFRKGVKY